MCHLSNTLSKTEAMESGRDGLYVGPTQAKRPLIEPLSLDLFSEQGVERSMVGSRQSVIMPMPFNDQSCIHFQIKKIPYHYLDLSSAALCGSIRVMRVDKQHGTEHINQLDNVGVCSYFPAALFSSMEVDIAGQNISKMNSNYFHYKTFLQTLLTFGKDVKDTSLKSAGWLNDEVEKFDELHNSVGDIKRKWAAFSRRLDFVFPLHSGPFSMDKLFPDFLDMDIRFHRTNDLIPLTYTKFLQTHIKPAFSEADIALDPTRPDYLHYRDMQKGLAKQDESTYSIKVSEICLKIRRIILKPDLVAEHQRFLNENKLLRYPWTRSELKIAGLISPGTKELKNNDLYTDRLPNSLIIALIDSKRFSGDLSLNCYKFENFKLNSIYLEVNQRKIPAEGFTPDFENDNFTATYNGLFENTGLLGTNQSNGITMELYKDAFAFYAFDLSPDKCLNYHSHGDDFGILSLTLTLAENAIEAITVLCLASFDETMSIDKDGQCFFDVAAT